jgi:hypothetical protein
MRELGVTIVSSRAYNILAAVLCTIAVSLTTTALFVTEPNVLRTLGVAAGFSGTVGSLAWIVAAIKG